MVLPSTGSISVSQILTEYGIPAATASAISGDLFSLVGGVPGTTCILPNSFYGKSSGTYIGAALVDGAGADQGFGVACDSGGNVYITGYYGALAADTYISNFALSPTRTGAPGTLPLTAGNRGGFVAKWSSAGTYIGAALVDGGGNDQGFGVACDSLNNVYITGYYGSVFASISNFALSPTLAGAPGTLPATAGGTGGFVAKWSSAGSYIGAAVVDGANADQGLGVACDSGGNVYITGYYTTGSASISNFALSPTRTGAPGTLPVTPSAGFVVKWSSVGTYIGAALVGAVSGVVRGLGVACDSLNNVYITGYYGAAAASISNFALSPTLAGAPGTLPAAAGSSSGFVAKWSSAGTYIGAALVDGPSSDLGLGVACDSGNNVYITGYYGTASISNFALSPTRTGAPGTLPTTAGGTGGFVAKWSSAGSYIGAAVVDGANADQGLGVACDSLNNVYITGLFGGLALTSISNFALSPTLAGAPGTLYVNASGRSVFVAKWNSAGSYIGAALVDGLSIDQGLGVACDVRRNVYITGFYGTSAASISNFALSPTLTGAPGTLPATPGGTGGFVAKWTP